MKKEHILAIRFSALGDVAMVAPVVYSVARQYPHVHITVLSRSLMRPIFEHLAPNVSFMEADLKHEYRGLKGLNALYRRLAAKQFTAVADLHSVLRSEYLRMRFQLGHYRVAHIDKHRASRRRLVDQQNRVMEPLPTSFENYADVFRELGYPVQLEFDGLFAATNPFRADDSLSQLPAAFGLRSEGQTWIGMAPFAAHQGKIYPPEQTDRVIRLLAARYPKSRIFLFGQGRDESHYFPRWCQEHPQCYTVSDETDNLWQELVLMGHLDVMLSMDSSNMHLASLAGTPVVSVWGATHPFAGFRGWGQPEENIIQQPLDCRPCSIYGQKPCLRGDYACLTGITPESIASRMTAIIDSKRTNTDNQKIC